METRSKQLAVRILAGNESLSEVGRELDLSATWVLTCTRNYWVRELGLPSRVVDQIGWTTLNSVQTDLRQLLEVPCAPRVKSVRRLTIAEMRDYYQHMPAAGYAFSP